jgi:drug/metabolite transporter (DMT)-like permease
METNENKNLDRVISFIYRLGFHVSCDTIRRGYDPPFLQAGLRFLISGLILVIWRRAAGDEMPSLKQWRSLAIVGTLLLLGGNGLVSFAEQRIASGVAALIIGTVPLWLVLIEAIRPGGVRPSWRALIGLIVGFGGIYLLIGPSELTGKFQFDILGTLTLITAAFLWSLGSIYSRSAELPKSALMTTGAEMLAGSIPIFIVSILFGELKSFSFAQVSVHIMAGVALPDYLRFDDRVRGLYLVIAKRACFSCRHIRVCQSACGSAAGQLARTGVTHGADSCRRGNHYRVGGIYQ